MNPINELILLFKENKIGINDNLMSTTISKAIEFSQIPTYNEIINVLKRFNERDRVEIYLKDESEDSITISNNINNCIEYEKFIRDNEIIESKISLKIDIKKRNHQQ